tara:strand:+ start:3709 stop:4383 length:675 start_codon:yes stop_codon:yes gene_type:complete
VIIKNKFGEVDPLAEVRDDVKVVGTSMSGGADSTMLCYLLAKCILEDKLNISIQPYNGYDIDYPGDSALLPSIIEYIRNKFPDVDLRWPMNVVYRTNSENVKNRYIRDFVKKMKYKNFDARVVGITLGPPIDVQKKFKIIWDDKNIKRLPGYDLYNEVVNHGPDASGPFKNVDKRFVIQCYKDYNMLDLLQKTASCIAKVKCSGDEKCWWCEERDWAIEEVCYD